MGRVTDVREFYREGTSVKSTDGETGQEYHWNIGGWIKKQTTYDADSRIREITTRGRKPGWYNNLVYLGSLASQTVGKAFGVVDNISLRSAFASGLTTMATAGVGSWAGTAGETAKNVLTNPFVRGAMSYGASHAAQTVTGQQAQFNWASLAAASVGAAVGDAIGGTISDAIGTEAGGFTDRLIRGVSAGAASGAAAQAFGRGGTVDMGAIAVDAFGNALGNTIGNALSPIDFSQTPEGKRLASLGQGASANTVVGRQVAEQGQAMLDRYEVSASLAARQAALSEDFQQKFSTELLVQNSLNRRRAAEEDARHTANVDQARHIMESNQRARATAINHAFLDGQDRGWIAAEYSTTDQASGWDAGDFSQLSIGQKLDMFSMPGPDGHAIADFMNQPGVARVMGGLQTAVGALEIGAGIALSSTGLGAIFGAGLATIGADNVIAGTRTMISGQYASTFVNGALQQAGLTAQQAAWAEFGLGFAGGGIAAARNVDALSGLRLGASQMRYHGEVAAEFLAKRASHGGYVGDPQLAMAGRVGIVPGNSRVSAEVAALRRIGAANASELGRVLNARISLKPYVIDSDVQGLIGQLDVSTGGRPMGFWSGNLDAAMAHSNRSGVALLETTPGGQVVNNWSFLNKRWDWSNGGEEFWGGLSSQYASGARGDVYVFQTPDRAMTGGRLNWQGGYVWGNYERPVIQQLQNQGVVNNIDYRLVEPTISNAPARWH